MLVYILNYNRFFFFSWPLHQTLLGLELFFIIRHPKAHLPCRLNQQPELYAEEEQVNKKLTFIAWTSPRIRKNTLAYML